MAWNPSPEVQVARDAATAIGKVRPFFVMALSAKSQRTVSGLSADCQRRFGRSRSPHDR